MFRRFFLGPNCNSWRHIYIMYLRRRKAQSHRRHPAIGRAALHTVDSNMSLRPVKRLIKAKPALGGAGVALARGFGLRKSPEIGPVPPPGRLRNDVPEDYLAGFPWHP